MIKKILFISALFIAALANAQSPPFQKPVTYGYEMKNMLITDKLGIPQDTIAIPTNLKNFAWLARKDGFLYTWSFTNDMWELVAGSGGGVTAVLGTANRITSSGGATPVINIAATYVGQSSITTVGTITSGVWNGTAIANANLANSSITIGSTAISLGSSSTTLAGLSSVTSTTFIGALTGNASTATNVAVGGITGLGTGVATALAINVGSAGSFVTFGGALGTPSSANLTNAIGYLGANLVLTDITANDATTSAHGFFPKLTSNSVYYVNNSGSLTALALGTSGQVLTSNGATSAPTFETPSASGGDYTILAGNNVTGGTNNYGAITSGTFNIALTNNTFNNLTSGSRNINIGPNSLTRLTTESDLINIGYRNQTHITTGSGNSGPGITIGHDNNGYLTYKNLAIGEYNIGYNVDSATARAFGRIVADNMAIGNENLINLYYGLDNMVFSWGGLESLDSGSNNNIFGQYGLGIMDMGSGNNAMGFKAGRRVTWGYENVFIGDSAANGSTNTAINHSVFIGANTSFTGTNPYNRIAIGDSAVVSQDNFMALGRTGTRVGIGRATATEQLHLDSAMIVGPRATTTDGTISYQGGLFVFRQGGADVNLGGSSGLTVGTTTITSGTNKRFMFDNSAVLGESANITQETNQIMITATSTSVTPLNIRNIGSQTAAAVAVQNSGGTGNFIELKANGEALFTSDVTATLQDPDGFDNTHMMYGGNNARHLVATGSGYDHRLVNSAGTVTGVYGGLDGGWVGMETNNSLNFITNKTTKAIISTGGNFLLGGTAIAASSTKTLHIFNGTVPTGSITDGVLLYSEDVAASAELKVRDEAGNITVLGPHTFTGIPGGRSEEMAWAFYSERDGKYINVDMLKLARLIEKITGEKLVYIGNTKDEMPNAKNK